MCDHEDEYEVSEYELALANLESWKADRAFKDCNTNELCVGDDVYCMFYPNSQRYIEDALPTYGTVVHIGDTDDDIKIERDGTTMSLFIGGFHMFGMARSYSFTLYKVVNTN